MAKLFRKRRLFHAGGWGRLMGGCVGGWVGGWVGKHKNTKNSKIKVIKNRAHKRAHAEVTCSLAKR